MTCFWYTVFDGDNSKEELKMKWKEMVYWGS